MARGEHQGGQFRFGGLRAPAVGKIRSDYLWPALPGFNRTQFVQAVGELDAGDEPPFPVHHERRIERADMAVLFAGGRAVPTETLSDPGSARSGRAPVQPNSTTGFLRTPIPSISISATSSGFMKIGGFLVKPTPPGVPVAMTSPASSVITLEM